ncbi:MAG TPA: hypothetical protein VEJ45_03650 [Candidatus Acidoferrales bacterium]|nr:hypothetical protein [Candidatus Acidoferrales bacterium]
MNPSDGKDSVRAHTGGDGQNPSEESLPRHRVTLELQRVERFAAMLAHSRSSPTIEISDYLAGMYICNWEHLSEYWADQNREEAEGLLRSICQISPQRWHTWIELYDQQHGNKTTRGWRLFRPWKSQKNPVPPGPSTALREVLRQAEKIAPVYERTEQRSIPVLNTECVLLCIVRNLGSEISRKLALAGLDIARLEREVLLPRRRPRR